ncbi:MAG: ATP-dependent RecD-like DNA helicase [Oscillospiraceae bacterium]|nr:ATP-dependent RecD-like DNA helicase [Oscillospiraceae bacterium]
MFNAPTAVLRIDNQILTIDKVICDSIDKFDASERGFLSQTILAQLRNFVEHVMLKIYANGQDIENSYQNICSSIEHIKTRGNLKFLRRFHDFLQIVASHYTLEEENSERLMLKYYEYLLRIKSFLKSSYSLDVLENLDNFPINTDTNLKEYYEKIAAQIDAKRAQGAHSEHNDRFYIKKVKPFFVNQKIYYEVTFVPANNKASKFDRIIAFTDLEVSKYYAAKLYLADDSIQILQETMPIHIIVDWETSIRPCEIDNFSRILGKRLNTNTRSAEYSSLMRFLTQTGFTLVEIMDFSDDHYQRIKDHILSTTKASHFFDVLDKSRHIIRNNSPGSSVLRYLLYHLNNNIIKAQRDESNRYLSELYLSNGCIPFDKMPFNTSLRGHNPRLSNLFECIDATDRRHELFARFIRNNTELKGQLYTSKKDIAGFEDIDALIQTYNRRLWSGHAGRRLEVRNDHVYIREYEDDTIFIVEKLKELTIKGVTNYSNSVISWLKSNDHKMDCEEKKQALIQMFEDSTVVLIYGSAGTGKSTLINHISHFFSDKSKLYLANTNPAVDNLKRRVDAADGSFSTIKKFLMSKRTPTEYDLLIVDECSTVSNRDMRAILEKATFGLLILVGDIYQIESIRFGNWFNAAQNFVPKTSVSELTTPYRSKNKALLELWNRVRCMDEAILELITKQGYSATLDASIFEPAEEDEIILCLNYDGLYGINNINRFLQQSNPSTPVYWGVQDYKVNDPILFNESERFTPLIYNNMKGRIVAVKAFEKEIQFDIELDKAINGMDARGYDFELLEDVSPTGNSIIRFFVNKNKSTDEDDDMSASDVVPFQVAYAVSIHKAQGLEYSSVKIVITDEIDELITHNIFYTAITRAREKLKIYWTPEVEKKVLSSIKPKANGKDVALLNASLKA